MTKTAKECRELRGDIVLQLQEIVEQAEKEQRSLSNEEREKFDTLDTQAKQLLDEAEGYERIEAFRSSDSKDSKNTIKQQASYYDDQKLYRNQYAAKDRQNAMRGWMTLGTKAYRREFGESAKRIGFDLDSNTLNLPYPEKRAMVSNVATAGGDFLGMDIQMMTEVTNALKAYGMDYENVVTVLDTEDAQLLPIQTSDDTTNSGRMDPEYSSSYSGMTSTDLNVARTYLQGWRFDSDIVKVSEELLLSSQLNLDSWIGERLGVRIGRQLASQVISGTGSTNQQLSGLLTGASSGTTSSSNTVLTYTDLLNLIHSVDPAYRQAPGCRFLCADSTLQAIESILDGNNRPLVTSSLEGLEVAFPQRIRGKEVVINQSVPAFAAAAKVLIFGDLKRYILRRVGGITIRRLVERYAEYGLQAFFAWGLFDGVLINPNLSNNPVKYLQVHA